MNGWCAGGARAEVASYAFSIACSREDWLEADAAARAARARLRDVETSKASALERGDDVDVVVSLTADVSEAEKAKRKAMPGDFSRRRRRRLVV